VTGISATGASYLQDGIHDVVFATITFDSGRIAHLHTSWLDPHKARSITVVGSEKMAVIDDVASTEKVRIYDKGVNIKIGEKRHAEYGQAMNIRSGDIQIPHIQNSEPLRLECEHFIDCIVNDRTPFSDGHNGALVVRLLEAGLESLGRDGEMVGVGN
ncbi:MAG: gfo/Idh/MocA family oxidoreductase, partial [Rhodothermales bacterium]|nr:gfo/Idh/MocA family oxidoreductase [Rhodothermales bacterium]